MTDRRPNPEELLRRCESEERSALRGKLKVFLGYASRVGKSYRMLDEGRRRKERGQDVVIGVVQAKVDAEVARLIGRFEIAGASPHQLDLGAVIRRKPEVCLVDELAWDNPRGSRNAHRWQDVNDLIASGVSVLAAVNLHHIAEEQEFVFRITGRRPAATVPARFVRNADEIEVVDAEPENLPDPSGAAQLREQALLLAADVVEKQLQEYLEANGLPQAWGTHERILVCLTPRSNAREMLDAGRRNAERFHGELLACYVKQPALGPEDTARLNANLLLARERGAKVHVLRGRNFVKTILDLAARERVSQLFIGHSGSRKWRFRRSPVDRLIESAEQFDIRLFPQERSR